VLCGAGELRYVLIGSPIQIASVMPMAFDAQPLLVYQDQWLLPQEPTRE
jgi:hypothetical protein